MPFVSPRVRSVLLVLAPVLLAVAHLIPAPVGPILGILAFVAGGLAGLASEMPRWVQGAKTYVPAGLAGSLLTVAGLLEQFAAGATGPVKLAMDATVLLLLFLAGQHTPAPVQVPEEEPRPVEKQLEPTPEEMRVNVDELLAASRPVEVDVLPEDKAA